MRVFSILVLILLLAACSGTGTHRLFIKNQSNTTIDSIVVLAPDGEILFSKLEHGQEAKKDFEVKSTPQSEGIFMARIFIGDSLTAVPFGYFVNSKSIPENTKLVIEKGLVIQQIK